MIQSDQPLPVTRRCELLKVARSTAYCRPGPVSHEDVVLTRISDFAVVPYGQDSPARLDFWGSDVGNPATEGDTLWVNYSMRRFSSRSMAS